MVQIVLGFIGNIGAGKDFVADYLVKEYGFQKMGMGDLVRAATKAEGLELTRKNQQDVSREFTDKYGMSYWSEKVSDEIIKLGVKRVAISGVRRDSEIKIYKKKFGSKFYLVFIDANSRIRFDRIKKRMRAGDPKTLKEFETQEAGELKLYKGAFEAAINLADFVIKNEDKPASLYAKIDALMNKIGIQR